MIKRFVKWVLPKWEYKKIDLPEAKSTGYSVTSYCELWCKSHNFKFVEWFPTSNITVFYKQKIKGWFE